MFQITLDIEDRFSLYTGVGANDRSMPSRIIERGDFPSAPETSIGQPVPIIYGTIQQTASTLARPTWVENYTYGMRWAEPWQFTDDGRQAGIWGSRWRAGYADRSVDPPTITSIADAASGNIDAEIVPCYNRFYVQALTIDASGNYSTMFPRWPAAKIWDDLGVVSVTSGVHYDDYSSDDRKFDVTFSWPAGATTGWVTRVFLGWNYYGIRWTEYIDVAHPATTCSFDGFGEGLPLNAPAQQLATGATLHRYTSQGIYFTVRAYDDDGEGPDSVVCYGNGSYAGHPLYFEWAAVSGATGYRIYQWQTVTPGGEPGSWGLPADPLRYWDVGNVTSTDAVSNDGAGGIAVEPETPTYGAPMRYVGQLTDDGGDAWHAWLLCGHAVSSVTRAYVDGLDVPASVLGTSLFLPGGTNWTSTFGAATYRDIGARRYTLVYGRGTWATDVLDRQAQLSVDVAGIESVGDGSGTLLTAALDQYAHWLEQWVLQDYQGGAWATTATTWGDTPYDIAIVDTASFTAAQTQSEARIGGGYTGAVILGAEGASTVRTWIARWNQSCDVFCGFSRTNQYTVVMIPEDPDLVTPALAFTADRGILADSFEIRDDVSAIENQILVQYRRDWVSQAWRLKFLAEDTDAQAAIGEVKPYALDLWAVTGATQAWDIAARRLQRRIYPYRLVTWEADMGGLTVDLGDVVTISHPGGVGSPGWDAQPVLLVRHELDPERFVVVLTGLDLDFLRWGSPLGSGS